ncbi:hypothetical protein BKA62DRAFT_400166 [Auriculariales sp. MPI-PUGE-AT-0066]|nr:hypothetical protein BKA62DRAFT_400166 [Auriculariales sp. MPI-PUGE-AT-0066]
MDVNQAQFTIPSARELELELVLTQRDARITELTDDLAALRIHLKAPTAEPVSADDTPVALPPPIVSLLVNHLAHNPDSSAASTSSVTTALTQRVQLLQEENDELYALLRRSETGKLREQVSNMQQVIERLEAALQDSHSIIKSLNGQLDKTCNTLQSLQNAPSSSSPAAPRAMITSNTKSYAAAQAGTNSRNPPTGPRAQKRQRAASPSNNGPRLSSANATVPRERERDRDSRDERDSRDRERERDRGDRFADRDRERERSRSRSPARKARRAASPRRSPQPSRSGGSVRGGSIGSPASRTPDLWPPPEHDNSGGPRRIERERPKRSGGGGRRRGGKPRDRERGLAERLGL